MAYRLLGSGTTDSNGRATYTYTGTGAGEIDVVASLSNPISSSSLQSEPFSVMDAKWIYSGTNYQTSHLTKTANSDGSYTLGTDGTDYGLFGASTVNNAINIFADIGGAFEFDLIEYSGAITLRCNISSGSNRDVNNVWTANTHYKIEIVDNGVKINGTLKSFADTGARDLRFRLENNATFTIKNLLYY